MKVLIIGSGGREHALAVAYATSHRVKKVLVAPGNDFIEESSTKIQAFPHISLLDFDSIHDVAKKHQVDLIDVAQDNALAEGFVDKFVKRGFAVFGPNKAAAELEWNKEWARGFMKKYHLPTPRFESFTKESEAISYIKKLPEQTLFIKASGLAFGKGVIKATTREEAIAGVKEMRRFDTAGKTFLIEEGMTGEEFSLFAICDGKRYSIAGMAQDHKTVNNGDLGPNTGGMGCISPTSLLKSTTVSQIKRLILNPLIHGMQMEGRPYSGILYLGGMMTSTGPKIVEFNARWGEPEANVIIPALKTDYVDIVQAVMMQELMATSIEFDGVTRISVAGCARGYPLDFSHVKGKKIYGLKQAMRLPGVSIFGAGIKRKGKEYVVSGGRIFHLVAEGKTIAEARERAYGAMANIFIEGNNLHYRTDIGWREVERHQ